MPSASRSAKPQDKLAFPLILANTRELLESLRRQATLSEINSFGSHQLAAHLSLAYACEQGPEPWELSRVPALHLLPSTNFYVTHERDIQEALKPKATWEMLQLHAIEKINLSAEMTIRERKAHGFPGNVHYFDATLARWSTINVPGIRWFDARELIRQSLLRTKSDLIETVTNRLLKLRERTQNGLAPHGKNQLLSFEKYIGGQFQVNLRRFEDRKREERAWLIKLDKTRDFGKFVFTMLRAAENEVRAARGIAAVGEAWVSETELLYRVKKLLPGIDVVAHGQPKWLNRQHLDIWIPALSLGIEYHGLQHFQPVEFFGGEEAFCRSQERDRRKRSLCEMCGVRLIEITYDQDIDDVVLRRLLLPTN